MWRSAAPVIYWITLIIIAVAIVKLDYPLWAEIDLERFHHNLDVISHTAGTPLLPVIKANAYGHGAVTLAKELVKRKDVAAITVGTVDEAAELRKSGIKGRIIVLLGVFPEYAGAVSEYGLEAVVSSYEAASYIATKAARKPVPLHFKINTGMTRLGAGPHIAAELYKRLSRLKGVKIAGVMTHLADSDRKNGFTNKQLAVFDEVCASIRDAGFTLPPRHVANTSGVFIHPKSRYELVRPGIGIFGVQPFAGDSVGLLPVLSLRGRVSMLREVKKGTPVSYGGKWKSPAKRRVAVVGAGYADGYPRGLSNHVFGIINGRKVRQIGTVCMDNIMFDVTGVSARYGGVITLIGEDGEESVTAAQLARKLRGIPYEILCGIGRRVPRVYIRGGKVESVVGNFPGAMF